MTKVIVGFWNPSFLALWEFFLNEVLMINTGGYHSTITLLSETDGVGRITFVNDAFCRVSKFGKDELLGQPHSIVRHPDMPSELFERLWSTILQGDVFRGVFKNRARDGSHYWVNATIMAIRDQDDRIDKCIGVRHLIPDETTARKLFDAQAASMGLA